MYPQDEEAARPHGTTNSGTDAHGTVEGAPSGTGGAASGSDHHEGQDSETAAPPSTSAEGPDELCQRDRAVLALARSGWPSVGAKERAIRERLDLSPTRYYQLLNHLLDDPRAWRHDPVTVKRLRDRREEHRRLR